MIKNIKKISSFLLAFCLLLTAFITNPVFAVDGNVTEREEAYNVNSYHFYPYNQGDSYFYNGPYSSTSGYIPYWRYSKEYSDANQGGVTSTLEAFCFRANGDTVTYCLDLGKAWPRGLDMKYQSEDLDNRLNRVIKMGYPNKKGSDYGTSDVELEWATAVALKIVEGHEWRDIDGKLVQYDSDLTLNAFTNGVLDETFSRKYYNDKQLSDEQIAAYHEKAQNAKTLVERLVSYANDSSIKLDEVTINNVSDIALSAGQTEYMAGPFRANLISNSTSRLEIKVTGASSDYKIVDVNGNVLNNVSFGQDFYIKGTTVKNLNIRVQLFASDLSTTPIRLCYASDEVSNEGLPYQRMYVAKSVTPQVETDVNVSVSNPNIKIIVHKRFDNEDIDFTHAKINKEDPSFNVSVNYNGTTKSGVISSTKARAYTFEVPISQENNDQVFTIKETIPNTFPENKFSFVNITTNSTDENVLLEKINDEYKLTLKNGITSDVELHLYVLNHLDVPSLKVQIEKITTGTDRAWRLSGLDKNDKHEFSLGINNGTYSINDKEIKNLTIYPGTYIFEEKDLPEIWTFVDMRALNAIEGVTFEKYTDTSYRLKIENTVAKNSVLRIQVENKLEEISEPTLCLKINKKITGTDAAFERLKLDKNAKYNFGISLVNQSTGDVIKGVIDNKSTLTINDIPFGTYLITEDEDMYFDFVDMVANTVDGVTFTKQTNGYILTIGKIVKDDIVVNITVNNKIEPDRPYEDKEEKENLFKN